MPQKILISILIGLCAAIPVFARVPNDPDYSEQWYLDKINAPEAWDIATGTRDTVVAVLDSGVDFDHPDLVVNLWTNFKEIDANGVDDDGNGYVDDGSGWDFVDNDNTAEPNLSADWATEGAAHGTVIAGLIGAVGNNSVGVSGVSWKTRIMPLRILDSEGAGESQNATKAILYAIENGADVINLSFTGFDVDPEFEQAVNEAYLAGIPVIAAVGNKDGGGMNLDKTPLYPACFEGKRTDWVIGVAATTEIDTKAEFSNYGADCTEISAPGVDIYGLMYQEDDEATLSDLYSGGWSGTSVAAPLVSGAVALLKSAYPSLTPSLVRTVLQLSADPIKEKGTAAAGKLGAGRLNIGRAFEIAPSFASAAAGEPETGLSPITGLPEEITPVKAGTFIRSAGFTTVYYVDTDETRHPLWDTQTYFTWNDSWDDVVWVTDATLATLPLGEALPPKPGVVLVKIPGDQRTYAVEDGDTMWRPTLREIPSEDVAVNLYGANWADYIIDLDPVLFSHYEIGDPLTSVDRVDASLLKDRLSLSV